jgi:hypothetical protein
MLLSTLLFCVGIALVLSFISQLFSELKAEIKVVRTEIKAEIQVVRTEIKAEIQVVRAEMKEEMQVVRAEMKEETVATILKISQLMHDKVSDIAEVLRNVSYPSSCKANDVKHYATFSLIRYKGIFYEVGVKHDVCMDQGADRAECPDMDVVLRLPNCRDEKYALDADFYLPLRMGDVATTVGYVAVPSGSVALMWSGHLSGLMSQKRTAISSSGKIIEIRADEYLFGANELTGMSGGPSANGNGFTGIVHATYNKDSELGGIPLATVIPFGAIVRECISQLNINAQRLFATRTDLHCRDVTVLKLR